MPVLDVDPPPPSESEGQVIVDAEGAPARVSVVLARAAAWSGGYVAVGVQTREVCSSTPCVVNLPAGEHELIFTSDSDPNRHSVGRVKVSRGATVFRHDLGEEYPGGAAHDWGTALTGLGILGAITGGSIWFAGAVADSDKTASAGKTTTLLSGLGIGVGIGLILSDRPTVQDGSSVQWTLGPVTPSPTPLPTQVTDL